MRKVLLLLALGMVFSVSGCAINEKSTIFSTAYWKRVHTKIVNDMHDVRVDFDRIVLDLEDRPIDE